jgi:hypothetical protein
VICDSYRIKFLKVADVYIDNHGKETIMEMIKVMAGWSKICPGCNIGRKYPESFIGKKVRDHWGKGCISHNAYVEAYGEESSPKKDNEKPDKI